MDRAEVVAALKEAYEKGGMEVLSAICDDIRAHGPLHDQEFVTCPLCGDEFELTTHPNGVSQPRCIPCRHALHAADLRRRHYERKNA